MGYKMEFAGLEGWFMGALLLSLPFIVLTVFIKLFLSEKLPSLESFDEVLPGEMPRTLAGGVPFKN